MTDKASNKIDGASLPETAHAGDARHTPEGSPSAEDAHALGAARSAEGVSSAEGVRRAPSVKDVARLAGVSEQTVSRTVHDSPAVRPETKARVLAAIQELGYRPNSAGLSLRRGHYMAIGVAMGNITAAGNLDRLEGFVSAAERHGYAITLVKMDRERPLSLGEASRRISGLSVDGMVYVLNRMPADFRSFTPLSGFPTIIVSMEPHPSCPTVDSDQRGSSIAAVDYLLERGHERIWHIAGPLRSLSSLQREEGWRHALAVRGLEAPEVLRGDWTPESGYEAGARLARLGRGACTAVFASNDAMAYGCICALRDAGLSVPEDVSVIGVDDDLGELVPHAGLTSLKFDNERIATWAIDKIVKEGAGGQALRREHMLFPGTLVERESVTSLR